MRMKKWYHTKPALLLLLLPCCAFLRNPVMDPCLQEVDTIFKMMYSNVPTKDKVSYVNYDVITRMRPQGKSVTDEVKTSDVKIYSGENGYRFISSDVSVFRDKDYTFTVIHAKKIIYWAASGIAANKDERLKQASDLHDTLFSNYQKVECHSLPNGEKQITLIPHKKWVDRMQISSVDYYINTQKKEIQKQVIEYTKAKKIKSVEYSFKEVSYDYQGLKLNGPVKPLFLASDTKLKAPYTGYTLIDVRNQKK